MEIQVEKSSKSSLVKRARAPAKSGVETPISRGPFLPLHEEKSYQEDLSTAPILSTDWRQAAPLNYPHSGNTNALFQ